jgi:hypothetical protein
MRPGPALPQGPKGQAALCHRHEGLCPVRPRRHLGELEGTETGETAPKMAWPPPQIPLGVFTAQSMAPAAHPSGEWWQVKEEEARALRERQEREAAEQEAKAREDWRGPRWWEGGRA